MFDLASFRRKQLGNLDGRIDLDREAKRQAKYTDCRSCMLPAFAKNLNQQVRACTISEKIRLTVASAMRGARPWFLSSMMSMRSDSVSDGMADMLAQTTHLSPIR